MSNCVDISFKSEALFRYVVLACGFQVNKYYDLVTSFYEFGWGESFHFAHRCLFFCILLFIVSFCCCFFSEFWLTTINIFRWKGESLRESIKRHEHFLGLQLGLKPGQKVCCLQCNIQEKRGIEFYPFYYMVQIVNLFYFAPCVLGVRCGLWNWGSTKRDCSIQVDNLFVFPSWGGPTLCIYCKWITNNVEIMLWIRDWVY